MKFLVMWYSCSMIPFHSHETPIDWVHTQYSTSTSLLQTVLDSQKVAHGDTPRINLNGLRQDLQAKNYSILIYIHIYIYIHIHLKVIINQHAYAGHFKSITIIQTWMLGIHLDLYPSIQPQPPVVRRGVEHRNEAVGPLPNIKPWATESSCWMPVDGNTGRKLGMWKTWCLSFWALSKVPGIVVVGKCTILGVGFQRVPMVFKGYLWRFTGMFTALCTVICGTLIDFFHQKMKCIFLCV